MVSQASTRFDSKLISRLVRVLVFLQVAIISLSGQSASAQQLRQGVINNEYASLSTTYEPLNSWVYPAFERLSALGFTSSALSGMKPWTRRECARIVLEAVEQNSVSEGNKAIAELLYALNTEFRPEIDAIDTRSVEVRSVYVITRLVSGTPLNDAYHFGQTIENDLGRPVRSGVNLYSGVVAKAQKGPFAAYITLEHRYSPFAAPLPLSAREAISTYDAIPLPSGIRPQQNRLRVLDSYVTFSTEKWIIAVGKQSIRWGFARAGSLSFTETAEPITLFRIARTSPTRLKFLPFLGGVRSEWFVGRLEGHQVVQTNTKTHVAPLERQPWIQGGRVAFKPTQNLEFGIGISSIFSGPESPLTLRTFLRSFSLGNSDPRQKNDPGDRRSSFDIQYRLPFIRDWATFYVESMTEDEFSPIAYPRRSSFAPGVYFAKLPGLSHFDLRLEGAYTDLPNDKRNGVFFANSRYRNGFSNKGYIFGHPVGRQGTGVEIQTTYWRDAIRKVQIGYRDYRIGRGFMGGGSRRAVRVEMTEGWRELCVNGMLEYGRWKIPVLAAGPQTAFVASWQLTWRPNAAK